MDVMRKEKYDLLLCRFELSFDNTWENLSRLILHKNRLNFFLVHFLTNQ